MHRPCNVVAGVALAIIGLVGTVGPAGAQTSDVQDRSCDEGTRAKGDGDVCTAGTREAKEILDAARGVFADQPINGLELGVWKDGEQVVTGALGEALPGVPATRADHFRIGNVTESFTTTLLLMLVEDGTVSLDDPVSKWYPDLPEADAVTLEMLARSTSGYPDYVTNDAFVDVLDADPFQTFDTQQLLDFAFSQPVVFSPPGSSWAFSDTNFVLLGAILEEAGGKPVGEQLESRILDELDLSETLYTTSAEIFPPVLHGYSAERGAYEDSSFWNPSWIVNTANMSSDLADMGRWARALGEGELVSTKLHELQIGDENVGLGPLTETLYYGMGSGISNDWIVNNPQIFGYTGIVAYLPEEKTAVVVVATPKQGYVPGYHYAADVFNAMADVIAPDRPPNISVQPRG